MRRALALACALLLALAAPAAAQQYSQDSSIVIRSFNAELLVQPDGDVEVTEMLQLAFTGRWQGILRDLSLRHNTAQGRRQKLDVELIGATDGAGQALRWEEDDTDDSWMRRMRIYIPGAQNNERTVVIRYRVRNAIRFYFARDSAAARDRRWDWCRWAWCPSGEARAANGAFDELYWNATGNRWDMPIERAHARIVLPAGVRPLQWAAYTGPEGSTEQAVDVTVDSARGIVSFAARRRLEPYEGMTVAAGWPPGAIATRPTQSQMRRLAALRLWPLALPLVAFVLAMRAWRRRGRDPEGLPVVVGYEPPGGMSPAEAGTLIDHRAETRDIISTLVDLAVRGHIGIEEREEKKLLGLLKDTDYVFHQRTPPAGSAPLLPHEQRFLDGLFASATGWGRPWDAVRATYAEAQRAHASGREMDADEIATRLAPDDAAPGATSVRLSDLKEKFYTSLPGIRDGIYDHLIQRGYYRARPDKVKGHWMAAAIVVLVLGGVGSGIAADAGIAWVSAVALIVGTAAAALVLLLFGWVMPARTVEGARAREAALGFREFLSKVESDRYRMMITSPEMFERYLPYAMAFGVEDRWASAFDDMYREPPDWYSGSGYGNFRASNFTSRMSTLSSSAGSTMTSSPSSSGSGGGGSSGGGSGGGGGSGF
jgi:hypothetical protein